MLLIMNEPDWRQVTSDQKEFLLKEIEVVQNHINKCDEYSLIVKGWAITLWSALLLFAISQIIIDIKISILWVSIIILLVFWIIDAYFKYFQRTSIARSNLISDYLNNHTPENDRDFTFRIYDPVGRISKERKRKEKRKENYYWKNYFKRLRFLRAFVVRVVSSLYCFLIGFTFIFINIITQNCIFLISSIISFFCVGAFFFLSHIEKI